MSGQFEVFLQNIGLSGMDGTELVRRLQALPAGCHALMVAITGRGRHFDRKNALKAGLTVI